MFCKSCGAEIPDDSVLCSQCGKNPHIEYEREIKNVKPDMESTYSKSRLIAGILQILLAPFGAGRIYLGYYFTAAMQIFLTFITGGIAVIWPLIDGILILAGTPASDSRGRPIV